MVCAYTETKVGCSVSFGLTIYWKSYFLHAY